eukprot:PhF_6_TR30158/c0_g1_i2/m.44190/K01908/prpE; propionyl-CoA synthetase
MIRRTSRAFQTIVTPPTSSSAATSLFTTQSTHEALQNPESFWSKAGEGLSWSTRFTAAVPEDPTSLSSPWFRGGKLNLCYNAVDRHAEGSLASKTALIFDSAMTNTRLRYSYSDLMHGAATVHRMLVDDCDVKPGDTVVIYMPMIPEAVMAMLGCARAGAIHSVVFGGFSGVELGKRVKDCNAKVILSASCGLEPKGPVPYKQYLDVAIDYLRQEGGDVQNILVQRTEEPGQFRVGQDRSWASLFRKAASKSTLPPVPIPSDQPAYILYTSGTTGIPKGISRAAGGYGVITHHTTKSILDIDASDTIFTASDVGWIVGHSYIVYGPLMRGATTVLYEGKPVGTPNPGSFWRVMDTHNVNTFFTAPTAIRALKQTDPKGEYRKLYKCSALRRIFLAGERSDPDTLQWLAAMNPSIPIIDNWWQTETGSPITATPSPVDLPLNRSKFGSAGVPCEGWRVKVLDRNTGEEVPRGTLGDIVLQLPLPPGALSGLHNDTTGSHARNLYITKDGKYFRTFDAGKIDEDGYVHVMTRTDDVINVAGHRLSTGQIEEVISSHPSVAECAVVGAKCGLKGERPYAIYVVKQGVQDSTQLADELNGRVRECIGALSTVTCVAVPQLPKTRSGKVLRKIIRAMVNGEFGPTTVIPPTIEDVTVVETLQTILMKKQE